MRLRSFIKYLLLGILGCYLALITPQVQAQIPLPNLESQQEGFIDRLFWDLNAPEACGNLQCSNVYVDGSLLFTVTARSGPGETVEDARQKALGRAKYIQNSLNQALDRIAQNQRALRNGNGGDSYNAVDELTNRKDAASKEVDRLTEKIATLTQSESEDQTAIDQLEVRKNELEEKLTQLDQEIEFELNKSPRNKLAEDDGDQFLDEVEGSNNLVRDAVELGLQILEKNILGSRGALPGKSTQPIEPNTLHPDTPKIAVGIQNDQYVIFLPEQPGLVKRNIVTVTANDASYYGAETFELADSWRLAILRGLSAALFERDNLRQEPLRRPIGILMLLVYGAICIFLVGWVRGRLRRWDARLRNQLRQAEQLLKIDPEGVSSEQPQSEPEEIPVEMGAAEEIPETEPAIPTWRARLQGRISRRLANLKMTGVQRELMSQNVLRQSRNFLVFFIEFFFYIQLFIIFVTLGLIALTFPDTRLYGVIFWAQAVLLPLLWILMSVCNQGSAILIDYSLNKWAQEGQKQHPNSRRYTLRASTYSPALKSIANVAFIGIGFYLTFLLLGVNIAVLTGTAIVAAFVTYLSGDLIKNFLNGAAILLTDQFAIGDIINVSGKGGLVENMNLCYTKIRGSEGRQITIPNGQILAVENMTKDWSRFEFKVELAYENDIPRALELTRQVAEEMSQEPDWKDKFIEPPLLLGVDTMSHSGLMMQLWIKTVPMQQFSVGREYRLRIKEAFEREGVTLGIPQRTIQMKDTEVAALKPIPNPQN
ncbi:MAG: mechanosensitive ion channel domain-containing protein [Cyanobacteria bacterium P01_H01_bin.15]